MRRLTLRSGEQSFPLEIGEADGRLQISLSGKSLEFSIGDRLEGGLSILIEGQSFEARAVVEGDRISVQIDGERRVFGLDDDAGSESPLGRRKLGSAEVVAPMPGKVVKLLAVAGEEVKADQGVLLFEAMKMQNEIRSPVAGTLAQIDVREGEVVEARDRLFVVKAGEN